MKCSHTAWGSQFAFLLGAVPERGGVRLGREAEPRPQTCSWPASGHSEATSHATRVRKARMRNCLQAVLHDAVLNRRKDRVVKAMKHGSLAK